jgi:hypothetical protein
VAFKVDIIIAFSSHKPPQEENGKHLNCQSKTNKNTYACYLANKSFVDSDIMGMVIN